MSLIELFNPNKFDDKCVQGRRFVCSPEITASYGREEIDIHIHVCFRTSLFFLQGLLVDG